jgi:hypothetical protein
MNGSVVPISGVGRSDISRTFADGRAVNSDAKQVGLAEATLMRGPPQNPAPYARRQSHAHDRMCQQRR